MIGERPAVVFFVVKPIHCYASPPSPCESSAVAWRGRRCCELQGGGRLDGRATVRVHQERVVFSHGSNTGRGVFMGGCVRPPGGRGCRSDLARLGGWEVGTGQGGGDVTMVWLKYGTISPTSLMTETRGLVVLSLRYCNSTVYS